MGVEVEHKEEHLSRDALLLKCRCTVILSKSIYFTHLPGLTLLSIISLALVLSSFEGTSNEDKTHSFPFGSFFANILQSICSFGSTSSLPAIAVRPFHLVLFSEPSYLLKTANSNLLLANSYLEILLSMMTGNMALAVMDNAEGA